MIDQVKSLFSSCVASYASSNEDKTNFHQSRWRVFPPSKNGSLSILYHICPSAWNYSSAKETQSLPLWGRLHLLNIYGEGGYLAELGYDKSTALRVISELNLFDWIDRLTSAVIVEFTVFNSRVNLFSMSWIPIEFSPSGHVISSHVIRSMHIYDIGGGYSAVTIACQLLLLVYIIYFVVKETKQMIAGIRLYFSQFLNWVELTQTVTVIGFVITHILKETELFANTAKLSKNTFQFIAFDKGVLLDDMETVLLSLLMFLNTLKLLHLLKFNPHVRHLFYVMKASARELIHCSLGLAVFMFGSIHVGYLLFGRELYSFSSPFITLQSLIVEGVVGDGVDHFCDCCMIIGPVYLTALKLSLNVLCMNIFICVLVYNYSTIRKLPKGTYDVGHFMIVKIKEVLRWMGDSLAMNADISAHAVCNPRKADVPNTNMEENTLDAVDEILTKLDRINHLLNVLYADEFGEDYELFSLWFDLHMQAKKSASKDAQESGEDEEEQWEDAQAYFTLV